MPALRNMWRNRANTCTRRQFCNGFDSCLHANANFDANTPGANNRAGRERLWTQRQLQIIRACGGNFRETKKLVCNIPRLENTFGLPFGAELINWLLVAAARRQTLAAANCCLKHFYNHNNSGDDDAPTKNKNKTNNDDNNDNVNNINIDTNTKITARLTITTTTLDTGVTTRQSQRRQTDQRRQQQQPPRRKQPSISGFISGALQTHK